MVRRCFLQEIIESRMRKLQSENTALNSDNKLMKFRSEVTAAGFEPGQDHPVASPSQRSNTLGHRAPLKMREKRANDRTKWKGLRVVVMVSHVAISKCNKELAIYKKCVYFRNFGQIKEHFFFLGK